MTAEEIYAELQRKGWTNTVHVGAGKAREDVLMEVAPPDMRIYAQGRERYYPVRSYRRWKARNGTYETDAR